MPFLRLGGGPRPMPPVCANSQPKVMSWCKQWRRWCRHGGWEDQFLIPELPFRTILRQFLINSRRPGLVLFPWLQGSLWEWNCSHIQSWNPDAKKFQVCPNFLMALGYLLLESAWMRHHYPKVSAQIFSGFLRLSLWSMNSIIFVSRFGGGPRCETSGDVPCQLHPHHHMWLWGDRGIAKAPPCTMPGLGNVVDAHNNYSPLTTCGTATNFRFWYVFDFSC